MNKVLGLLQSAPSVEAKAADYAVRIEDDLYNEMIRPLEDKLKELGNKITDELDFTLNTDLNKGIGVITRPQVQERVKNAIKLRKERKLVELDLKVMQEAFDEMFDEQEEEPVKVVKRTRKAPEKLEGQQETPATQTIVTKSGDGSH